MASSSNNSETSDIFNRFLQSNQLAILPIGSCQCGKSAECDRLSTEINSLKEIHIVKEKAFGEQNEKLNADLHLTKEALELAGKNATKKDTEIKNLQDLLLKERTEVEEKSKKNANLNEKLGLENTNMENKIAELHEQLDHDQENLTAKITTLTGFLKLLGEQVKFHKDDNADAFSSTELQKLLMHIKDVIKTSEQNREGLQFVAKGYQAAFHASGTSVPFDKPLDQSEANSSPELVQNQTTNSSTNLLFIKKNEHEVDKSFKYEGFRCICGFKTNRERNVLHHIRLKTETWKFHCESCTKKFFYKSTLESHLKLSTKCGDSQEKANETNKDKAQSQRQSDVQPNKFQTGKFRKRQFVPSKRQPYHKSAQSSSTVPRPQNRNDMYQLHRRESPWQRNGHQYGRRKNFSSRHSAQRRPARNYHFDRSSKPCDKHRYNNRNNDNTSGQQTRGEKNHIGRNNHSQRTHLYNNDASGGINTDSNMTASTSTQLLN